jgi:hypothetical protein
MDNAYRKIGRTKTEKIEIREIMKFGIGKKEHRKKVRTFICLRLWMSLDKIGNIPGPMC